MIKKLKGYKNIKRLESFLIPHSILEDSNFVHLYKVYKYTCTLKNISNSTLSRFITLISIPQL